MPIRKVRCGLLLICVVLLFTLFPARVAQARSLLMSEIDVVITASPEGHLHVRQMLTIQFIGSFTVGYLDIDKGGQEVSASGIENFIVYESAQEYTKVPDLIPESQPAATMDQWHTFAVEDRGDYTRVEWYFNAEDETRTFVIEYDLLDSVMVYADTAVIDTFIKGDRWQNGAQTVKGTVLLPGGASKENVLAWAHGPSGGDVSIQEDGSVILKVDYVGASLFVDVRILAPVSLFPKAKNVRNMEMLETVKDQERKWAEDREEELQRSLEYQKAYEKELELAHQRERFGAVVLSPIVLVLSIVLGILLRTRRKRFVSENTPQYYRDIPNDLRPDEFEQLYYYYGHKGNGATSRLIVATLLDLAVRRVIAIEPTQQKKDAFLLRKLSVPNEAMRAKEMPLLDFLFSTVGNGDGTVTMGEIKAFGKRRPERLKKVFDSFTNGSANYLSKNSLEDPYAKGSKPKVKLGLGILWGLAALASLLLSQIVLALAFTLGVLIFFLFLRDKTKRLKPQGEQELVLWQALKRFFDDFTLMKEKEVPELAMWERYLVYATSMGVSRKIMKQLPIVYPQLANDDYLMHHTLYFYAFSRGGFNNAAKQFDAFHSSVTTSYRNAVAALSHVSNASGGGGGFSSGGGRGVGGGGGGFR